MASVNDLSFVQAAAILNELKEQATGQKSLTPINNLGDWISVATTTLATGYDPVMGAISLVLGRTVNSERPYGGKFRGLQRDSQAFGAYTRKLSFVDLPMVESKQFDLADGTSVDPYIIRKKPVLQTNIYGGDDYQYFESITKDQLHTAFQNPESFSDFMGARAVNMQNNLTQTREMKSRAVIADLITGRIAGAEEGLAPESVVHLLTEYKNETGLTDLTPQTVKQPENYPAFIKWVYGRVEQICSLMTERSQKFQTNVIDKPINRHTERPYQRLFIQDQALKMMTSRVLADTFHENMLNMSVTEGVNFWQSIDSPFDISAQPAYMAADGTIKSSDAPVEATEVFGLIMDRDAAGLTLINEETNYTQYNPRGKYWNLFHTGLWRWWADFTEKSVVLLLD